jgi:hypothetical protein
VCTSSAVMSMYHKQPTCFTCNPHLRFYAPKFFDPPFVSFENKYFLLIGVVDVLMVLHEVRTYYAFSPEEGTRIYCS